VLRPAAEAIGLVEHNHETGKEEPWVGFRHTCASMLIDDGKSILQVAAWLGHENPKVTVDTYAHPRDRGLGEAGVLDGVVCPVVGNGRATQHPEPAANGSGVTRCDPSELQGNPRSQMLVDATPITAHSAKELAGGPPQGQVRFQFAGGLLRAGGAGRHPAARIVARLASRHQVSDAHPPLRCNPPVRRNRAVSMERLRR
jgi:hypothetical protein